MRKTDYMNQKKLPNLTTEQYLEQHWEEYLKGFSKFIIQIGEQFKLNIRPIYGKYLLLFKNKPLISIWTVAKSGHQNYDQNGIIQSKYNKKEKSQYEYDNLIEDNFPVNFEEAILNEEDDQKKQDQLIKEKKFKNISVYQVRKIKRDFKLQKASFGSTQEDFINYVYNSIKLNNAIYFAIIHFYFEQFYIPSQEQEFKLNNSEKNKLINKYLQGEKFKNMALNSKIQYLFLYDLMVIQLKSNNSFKQLFEEWRVYSKKELNIQKENKDFLIGRINLMIQCIENLKNQNDNQREKLQDSILPLDFTMGLILIYATNIITRNEYSPSKIIQMIKQRKTSFLDGFSKFMTTETTFQYLTIPKNLPKPPYIRQQAIRLLKKLQMPKAPFNKNRLLFFIQNFYLELNVCEKLIKIAFTFEKKYFSRLKVKNYYQDIYACSLLMIASKYYLSTEYYEAKKSIIAIFNSIKNIQPFDYSDLNHCSLEDIQQSLLDFKNLDGYYGDEETNNKLRQKLQEVENFFDSQVIQEQCQKPKPQIQAQKAQLQNSQPIIPYDCYEIMEDYHHEWSEVRALQRYLNNFLEETDEKIVNQFQKMEKIIQKNQ